MRITMALLAALFAACQARAEVAASPESVHHFDVLEYRIEGNSVLPVIDVEQAVYPFLGEEKTVEDVEKAREGLESAYREAGYLTVLVDIPEQRVDEGVVTLKVTEGKVERVRVTGSRYFSQGRILAGTPSLVEGGVPYFPEVRKELAAVSATPDRRVTPVLKPGKTPGTVEVELKVEDQLPLHGSLEASNRHSANTTPWRAGAMVRYDNLWQREHSLSLQFQTAPENPAETKVLSVSYVVPMSPSGDALALYAVRSRSDVAAVGDISVLGNGNIYGIRYILPLPAREQFFHSLTLGADYKDFLEDIVIHGADSYKTPISYLPFLASYSATAQGAEAVTRLDLSANFSLRGIGNTTGEFENKRFMARPNYFYLKGELEHTRPLFGALSLMARLGGQLSNQPLVSNEQYGAGGAESVRGYLESEALGDDAVAATVELRGPSLADKLPDSVDELRLLAFTEGAQLRVKEPLPEQQGRFTLSSAGFGVRMKAWRHLTAALDMGWPFKDTANTRSGEPRVHFKMVYEF